MVLDKERESEQEKRPSTGTPWLDLLLETKVSNMTKMAALLCALGVDQQKAITAFATVEDVILGKLPDTDDVDNLTLELVLIMRKSPQDRLAGLVDSAISYKERVMLLSHADPAEKARVASEILDRVMGKPTQTVVNHNTNLNVDTSDLKQVDSDLSAVLLKLNRLEEQRQLLLQPAKPKEVTAIDV